MRKITLPPSVAGSETGSLERARSVTIVGANGAGKSRFMDEMIHLCGEMAFSLNALSAFYPETEESVLSGSVDSLYREAVRSHSYMRTDAVSELDKLQYLLFADELEYLLTVKEDPKVSDRRVRLKPTKLDSVARMWERLFPGSRMTRRQGTMMFQTPSGDDLIPVSRLSHGERTALYYLCAALYAREGAVIFVESPGLFINSAVVPALWNAIEGMRPDCTFVYNSVDSDFVNSRTGNRTIWVRAYDPEQRVWDYQVVSPDELDEEMLGEFTGSRRPVLFIEGDALHSIDAKLYALVFPESTVRPLGSCNKVIETTRSFNDLRGMHHLSSRGIVDRDRRSDVEVEYLRRKQILVPDVAEVENIFLLPDVVKTMARVRGRDGGKIMRRVEREVMRMFRRHADEQALQHVRHRIKRDVECRIDGRFACITALEAHLRSLEKKLQPRRNYNRIREEFAVMIRDNDYAGVLRVFNHKPMLPDSDVHRLLGYRSKEDYIAGVIDVLRGSDRNAEALSKAVRKCLHADEEEQTGV